LRLTAPSLRYADDRWLFTVLSARKRLVAIDPFV
jgi:hypothetical protein